VYNRCEDSSTTFRVMVRAPLEHNDYRLHHNIAEPITSRHESRINHHIMVLVRTAGLALTDEVAARLGCDGGAPWRRQRATGSTHMQSSKMRRRRVSKRPPAQVVRKARRWCLSEAPSVGTPGCDARQRPEDPMLPYVSIDLVVVPACAPDPRRCGHSSTAVWAVAIARASDVVGSADRGGGPALTRPTAGAIGDGGKFVAVHKAAGEVAARPRRWAARAAEYKSPVGRVAGTLDGHRRTHRARGVACSSFYDVASSWARLQWCTIHGSSGGRGSGYTLRRRRQGLRG